MSYIRIRRTKYNEMKFTIKILKFIVGMQSLILKDLIKK